MGSDAHVVSAINFDKTNPYNQVFPDIDKDVTGSWSGSDCVNSYKKNNALNLVKEKINHQDSDFDKDNWKREQKKYEGREMWVPNERYNVLNHKHNPHADSEIWHFRTSTPKLLYFPHNYVKQEK